MNLPLFTAHAESRNRLERFETAIATLESGLDSKHVWNVDYENAKFALSDLAETAMYSAAKVYTDETRETRQRQDNDPRWMTVYTPQFMHVPGAVKKLEKIEKSEPALGQFLAMLREIAQVVELFKSVKPFIEKGRKPSETLKEVDLTNTGICPVCGKRQKLTSNGDMVAHGYTLPDGWGGRNGMCFGHQYPAFELSNAGAIAYVEFLKRMLTNRQTALASHQNKEHNELHETVRVRMGAGQYEDQTHTYLRGTDAYERLRARAIWSLEGDIRSITSSIKMYAELVTNWKLQPLMYGGKK